MRPAQGPVSPADTCGQASLTRPRGLGALFRVKVSRSRARESLSLSLSLSLPTSLSLALSLSQHGLSKLVRVTLLLSFFLSLLSDSESLSLPTSLPLSLSLPFSVPRSLGHSVCLYLPSDSLPFFLPLPPPPLLVSLSVAPHPPPFSPARRHTDIHTPPTRTAPARLNGSQALLQAPLQALLQAPLQAPRPQPGPRLRRGPAGAMRAAAPAPPRPPAWRGAGPRCRRRPGSSAPGAGGRGAA